MKFITTSALFLWLGTSIALVSAVDISSPPFDLLVRDYRRAVANYDRNGLHDRDLVDLDERDFDTEDFVARALFDELESRDIERRQAQRAGQMIRKLVSSIKGKLDKKKKARRIHANLGGKLGKGMKIMNKASPILGFQP